jgi:hypothetical protein
MWRAIRVFVTAMDVHRDPQQFLWHHRDGGGEVPVRVRHITRATACATYHSRILYPEHIRVVTPRMRDLEIGNTHGGTEDRTGRKSGADSDAPLQIKGCPINVYHVILRESRKS